MRMVETLTFLTVRHFSDVSLDEIEPRLTFNKEEFFSFVPSGLTSVQVTNNN